jgi:hypothetical protein
MLTATEDSIRSLSDENSENIVNTLASAKLALEQLYESGKGQFPREEALDDLMKIVEISKRIKATNNLTEKINIVSEEYQTFSKQLRSKYSDFLPTRVIRELEALEAIQHDLIIVSEDRDFRVMNQVRNLKIECWKANE